MNKYTTEEVAPHNNLQDLWIIIHGNVYDLTLFLPEHPGGEEVLLALAGQDGTECFESIGHSDEAKQLREKFKIGEITNQRSAAQSQITSAVQSETTSADAITADINKSTVNGEDPQKGNISLQVFTYVAIIMYAVIFYYYYHFM
jgi:cytochrome b involved in lipid metabolism